MKVVCHTNAAGDVSIGVEHEGAFVPFSALSRGKFAQYVQRAEGLQERAEAGDDAAREVLGTAYREPKSKGKGKDEPESGG